MQVGQAHDDDAEQADDHGRPGEQHRPAGGADRRRRLAGLVAVAEGVAVAGDDEQRVVDAHPDGDHRRHRRRPFWDVDEVGEQGDEPGGDPDAEHGVTIGRPHREQRPEADEQDHPGRRKPTPSAPIAPCSAFWTAWPASSICTASPLATAAASSSCWATSTGMSQVSSCNVA